MRAAPLRFLMLVVGGWICVRAAVLAPGWWTVPSGTGARASVAGPDASPAVAAQERGQCSLRTLAGR